MSDSTESPVERIVLDGEYDLSRREELREKFARVDGSRPIEIDLHALDYADSSFFHVLADLRRTYRHCRIVISGASPMMRRLLKMLDFDKIFTID